LVLNKAVVKRELLDTVKARRLAYYGHTARKQGSCLEKEIPVMQGIMPGERRRGILLLLSTTHGLDGTSRRAQDSPWKSHRMTEDRDKWRK